MLPRLGCAVGFDLMCGSQLLKWSYSLVYQGVSGDCKLHLCARTSKDVRLTVEVRMKLPGSLDRA